MTSEKNKSSTSWKRKNSLRKKYKSEKKLQIPGKIKVGEKLQTWEKVEFKKKWILNIDVSENEEKTKSKNAAEKV